MGLLKGGFKLRKILVILTAILMSMSITTPVQGSEEIQQPFQTLSDEGPSSGEFKAWTQMLWTGQEVKFYAKYPPVGKKIQFMVKNPQGIYEEFAWLRVEADDLDSNGNYTNLQNDIYFIRTLKLEDGLNRVRIYLDGEIVWGTKSYSRSDGPIRPEPEPEPETGANIAVETPSGSVQGQVDIEAEITGLAKGESVTAVCIDLNDSALILDGSTSIRLNNRTARTDDQGCFSLFGDEEFTDIAIEIDGTELEDGNHDLAFASVVNTVSEDQAPVISKNATFTTENFSLNVTSPDPMVFGQETQGSQLTGVPGNWPAGATLSYQWLVDGQEVLGASSTSYTLSGVDVGKVVSFRVDAVMNGEKVSKTADSATVRESFNTSPSSDSIDYTYARYSVQETNYLDEVDLTYQVELRAPRTVVCEETGTYYRSTSCNFDVEYRVLNVQGDGYFLFGKSIRVTDGAILADSEYESVFESDLIGGSSPWKIAPMQVGSYVSTGSKTFTLALDNADSRETYVSSSTGSITVIAGPNRDSRLDLNENYPSFVDEQVDPYIYSGRSENDIDWMWFSYSVPTKARVLSECVAIPIYAAPLDMRTGLPTASSKSSSDLTVTVRDSLGVEREELVISGRSGDWDSLSTGDNKYEIKLCDLSTRRYTNETVTVTFDFYYDQYETDMSYSTSESLYLYGGLEWEELNCYKGSDGIELFEPNPVCPEGWTETSAEIINGKVQLTTINCLRGTDVEVVTDPDPVCPSGYSETNLRVENGKLVPWTITCSNGLITRKVTGVFPSCPAGLSLVR